MGINSIQFIENNSAIKLANNSGMNTQFSVQPKQPDERWEGAYAQQQRRGGKKVAGTVKKER